MLKLESLSNPIKLWLSALACTLVVASGARAGAGYRIYNALCPPQSGSIYNCECYGYFPTGWKPWPCQPPIATTVPAAAPSTLPAPAKLPAGQQPPAPKSSKAPADDFRAIPLTRSFPTAK